MDIVSPTITNLIIFVLAIYACKSINMRRWSSALRIT